MTLAEAATRRTFRSLRVRNYRLFFFGQLVSVSGTWMQQIAQDWLVLRLTNEPLPVGITTALQFAPILALGAWAGVVADRLDKRRLLLATQAAMATLALVLGVLTATGAIRLWMVYLLALLLGFATAFDMPTRQAFVSEMVGPGHVANAIGLNSAVFNSARVVGPAAAGVVIATAGIATAFLVNAVSYLAVIGGLLLMDQDRLHRQAPVQRAGGQIRAGLRYVWTTPVLRSTIALVAVVGTLGLNYRVALPLLARFTFGGDATVYGLLASIMAAGSVVGALAAARRGRPSQALLLWSVAVFGVLSVAAAAAPTLALEMVVLAPLGLASIAFLATANSTMQLGSSPELRGRVMALYGLVFLGSTPLGGLLAGWMADRFGPRSILLLAGVSSLAAAGVAAVLMRGRRPAAGPEGSGEPQGPEGSGEPRGGAPVGRAPVGREGSGPPAGEAQVERW